MEFQPKSYQLIKMTIRAEKNTFKHDNKYKIFNFGRNIVIYVIESITFILGLNTFV